MLYKKIHRQYVRQFRISREFEYYIGTKLRVIGKPRIGDIYIHVRCSDYYTLGLIFIKGKRSGQIHYKEEITWLN